MTRYIWSNSPERILTQRPLTLIERVIHKPSTTLVPAGPLVLLYTEQSLGDPDAGLQMFVALRWPEQITPANQLMPRIPHGVQSLRYICQMSMVLRGHTALDDLRAALALGSTDPTTEPHAQRYSRMVTYLGTAMQEDQIPTWAWAQLQQNPVFQGGAMQEQTWQYVRTFGGTLRTHMRDWYGRYRQD